MSNVIRTMRILRRKILHAPGATLATAGPRIALLYNPNLIPPPDPQKKQALNRPVFLHAKLPVPESGVVQGFSVRLPAKSPETGRSGYLRKWQSGPAACPDGLTGGCSPPSLITGNCPLSSSALRRGYAAPLVPVHGCIVLHGMTGKPGNPGPI